MQRKNLSETRIYCQWVFYLRKKDDLIESNGKNPDMLEESMFSDNWIVELVTTAMQCFSFEDKKKHMTTHVTPNLQLLKAPASFPGIMQLSSTAMHNLR